MENKDKINSNYSDTTSNENVDYSTRFKRSFQDKMKQCVGDDPYPREKVKAPNEIKSRAYYLGVGVDSQQVPIFHDPNFDVDKLFEKDQLNILRYQENKKAFEEPRRLEVLRKEKEFTVLEQKKIQEKQRFEMIRMQAVQKERAEKIRIAEQNILKQQKKQASIKAEKEKRENEDRVRMIEQERKIQTEKAYKLAISKRKVNKKSFFSKFKKEHSKNINNNLDAEKNFPLIDIIFPRKFAFAFDFRNSAISFLTVVVLCSLFFGIFVLANKGLSLKGRVLGASTDGFSDLTGAIKDISAQNFEGSSQKFSLALANFSQASGDLESVGGSLMGITQYVPFASKLSSGKNAIEAGKHFSTAGKSLNEVAKIASQLKNPIDSENQKDNSLLEVFNIANKNIAEAKLELDAAQANIDNISIDDLPKDKQDKFLLLKQQLPDIRSVLGAFLDYSYILADLIGANGPRKYLFLFQNNSEMRATGGFIGSYGLMDISNGHIRKFFIDGIFNPDGQLRDKIVPPMPIQKISANWSMHDSNWFADFPTSAQKAIQFYEKTGGPTADGVIAITPTLMQKMLEVTGPIDMPEYDITLDADNFIQLTQYKVEVDYDKQENKPKKILADLAPLVLDKLMSSKSFGNILKTVDVFMLGLQQKHILLYSQDNELEKIIKAQNWSGEILSSQKDYISIINTNINGFKTDAIIDESIDHKAEIKADGSIIDTVTISRKHNGGNSPYEWLNKVNADYMRVYVPYEAKLLEVSGQTREIDNSVVDYALLGFKKDADIEKQENDIIIDQNSGTRIYNENGKTVFGNWTYVSPQETMTITYKYQLPFRMFQLSVGNGKQTDSYSLVAQKQSGSIGSNFVSHIFYPDNFSEKWIFPSTASDQNREIKNETELNTDHFFATVFEK